MRTPNLKRAAMLSLASPERLKRHIRTDAPFEFLLRPAWQQGRSEITVVYSIRSTVPGLTMGAIGAGIYFRDNSKVTTAANALPRTWNVSQINDWILSRGFEKPADPAIQVIIGLIVVSAIGGQMNTFSYMEDFPSVRLRDAKE
jgi:hypothetical protein